MSGSFLETKFFVAPDPPENGFRVHDAAGRTDDGFAVIRRIEGMPADYVFVLCYGGYFRQIGIPDLVGQTLRGMSLRQVERQIALCDEVLRTGEPQSYDEEFDRPGRCFEISVSRLDSVEHGELAVHVRDVTEQRLAEIALREMNATLEQRIQNALEERRVLADIVKTAPIYITAIDNDIRFLAFNLAAGDAFEEHYGSRPQAGDSLADLHAERPELLELSKSLWQRALDGETLAVAWSLKKQTRVRQFEGTYGPLTDAAGKRIGAYQHAYEVTDRVAQHQALLAAEAERRRWADLVDNWDADLLVADLEFRWIAVNRSASDNFERAYGVRPEIGASMLDQFNHLPQVREGLRAHWQRAFDGEEFVNVSMAFRNDKHCRRHYEIRFTPLRDAAGKQIGAYQFAYDVTSRVADQERLREVEEALRQSQKMEAVGQLTGGLAHDFNNLLAAISGSLDMIGARVAQGRADEASAYLEAGKASVKRAAALTHRLLAYSRRQTLSPKALVIDRLIADVAELVKRTAGPAITIQTHTAPEIWPTLVDANQLENALLNLCINARDALPGGGQIEISGENCRLEAAAAGNKTLEAGDYVAIRVSDNGIGIHADVIGHVFEPFFTTKAQEEGTGLGLSMVYGFARQSGGTVAIKSRTNEGTQVTIYLPRHAGEVAPAETTGVPLQEALPHSGEILVVDDEMLVRMMVADGLSDAGFVCAEAGDGAEAMRHIESDALIDLLVSDVGLPGGMNGRQLAEAARCLRPDLKVLFITGYADKAVLEDIASLAGTDVMLKPFDIDKLVLKVGAMIGPKPQA